MSIMPCYNDERSIENELGGRWELFYEENLNFDEVSTEALEFPTDFDETPLNLNGVLVYIEGNSTYNGTAKLQINNDTVLTQAYSMLPARFAMLKSTIENGFLNNVSSSASYRTTNTNLATTPYFNFTKCDSITNFVLRLENILNTTVKIYVLRGV